jgi:hypothetical protein
MGFHYLQHSSICYIHVRLNILILFGGWDYTVADQASPKGWKTLISSSKHVTCGPQLLHNICFITDIKHAKVLGKNHKVMMMIIMMCTAIRLLGVSPWSFQQWQCLWAKQNWALQHHIFYYKFIEWISWIWVQNEWNAQWIGPIFPCCTSTNSNEISVNWAHISL